MPTKLSSATLRQLPAQVRVPAYDRSRVVPRIVHVGVGNFHRAHQAVYTDDLLTAGRTDWGFCGVGLLPHDARIRDALRSQDHLYTLVERDAGGDQARVVGSIVDFRHATEDPEAVLRRMADPDCHVVSLTITEGGYYLHQGTGEFDAEHPDIRGDLAHPHQPSCSFGYLAEALDRRRTGGLAPFTVMSCDNVQGNGEVARKVLVAFAELRDPALGRWIAEHVPFPNSMVDRITPATTDVHRELVRDEFGVDDAWPVTTEVFKQWVIEDHFVQGRPPWEEAGAQITHDVLPYELMKLRLLNAGHQSLCYVGMLSGYEFAHEAMADPLIRRLVRAMMDQEATPLLSQPPGIDLTRYKDQLIERFANPAIRDQLTRIGTEGSARIPKFVLPSVVEELARGGPIRLLSFTVASWFRFLGGSDDQGKPLTIIDPMKEELCARARRGGADPGELLGLRAVFSEELARTPAFVDQVREALRSFSEQGTRATLARYADGVGAA